MAMPPTNPYKSSDNTLSDSTSYASNNSAVAVITSIFFIWGFLTALNDVLIPHLKGIFDLSYTRGMLVQFAFFGAYFVMSLPSGIVVNKMGYKKSIMLGLGIAGIGALLFVPAASLQSYNVFLGALFILASGITLLQVAANPYVSLLAGPEKATSRLNLAQALNSLGHTLAPMIGGVLILGAAVKTAEEVAKLSSNDQTAYFLTQAKSVQVPYVGLAGALFLLAFIVFLFKLPNKYDASVIQAEQHQKTYSFIDVIKVPHVALGALAIFFYVGAEVSIGSFLINFISGERIANITIEEAAHYVSFYWGGAMIGRFLGSAILLHIDSRKLLALYSVLAITLLVITAMTTGHVAMWAVLAIGLFNSIMFPTIFTLGIEKVGAMTGKASSLLVMGIVGGALVPLAQGVLADKLGIQISFLLPIICYIYIIFYALVGSKHALK